MDVQEIQVPSLHAYMHTHACMRAHTHTHLFLKVKISSLQSVPACSLSHVRVFSIPWDAVHQAPLSMGFPRWVYWSGLPFPPPGDLPTPGIEPESPVSPALAGRFFYHWATQWCYFSTFPRLEAVLCMLLRLRPCIHLSIETECPFHHSSGSILSWEFCIS